MKIEKCLISDLSELMEIEKECFDSPYTGEMLTNLISDSISLKAIDAESNKILGYIFLNKVFDEAELIKVAVRKQFRNKKIASILLDEAINDAKDIKKIFLEVNEVNFTAISFYIKKGFKQIFERKKYYKDNSALIMQKDM